MATSDTELDWRIANGVLFIRYCLGVGAFLRRGLKGTILLTQKIMTSIAFVVMALMLLTAFGYFRLTQLTYRLGLLVSVLASIHNFYLLLFPEDEETT